jgi:hypothetical protein
LKTERVAIAYRLSFPYPFVRPESEQNSSHLQIDCDRVVGNRDTLCSVTAVVHDPPPAISMTWRFSSSTREMAFTWPT